MNNALKSFVSFSLSFFILSVTLHLDHLDHDHHEGYSICDVSCNDEGHHSSSHHCEKCLNKTNRLMIQASTDAYPSVYYLSTYSLNESSNNTLLTFKLYSRPPPNLL
ncbi:MAG: hypothetical protein ACJZ14_05100 [Candidatus Neomarinimicrobiota bacterium]